MDVEQRQFDQPAYATATVAPGAANVAEVTITVRNVNGKPVGPIILALYLTQLAPSAPGYGLYVAVPSGPIGCKTPGVLGTDVASLTAKSVLLIQTLANGTYVLSITDAPKTGFRIALQIGEIAQVVATLVTASYG